jgi:hypothetical protein
VPEVAEVVSDPDVEKIVESSAARFITARATAITASNRAVAAAVLANWDEQLRPFYPPGATACISPTHQRIASPPLEPAHAWYEQVWIWAPDRSRVEADDPRGGKSLLIVNESSWAGWDPFRGTFEGTLPTNPRKRAIEEALSPRHAETALALLRPRRFLFGYTLEATGETIVANRRALRLRGIPAYDARSVYESGRDAAPAVFEGAEAAEFCFDAERGVLLRWAGYFDGQEYLATEFTAINFDEPLDSRLFDRSTVPEWVRANGE